MSLREIYETRYGGTEKTAQDVFDRVLGEAEEGDRFEKLAAAYEELGRGAAREEFAREVLGTEKTAEDALINEILSGEPEAEPEAEEPAVEKEASEISEEELTREILDLGNDEPEEAAPEADGDGEKLAAAVAEYEEKLASEDKEAALALRLIKEAAKGKKGAKAIWKAIVGLARKGKGKAKKFVGKGVKAVKKHPVLAGTALATGAVGGYAAGKAGSK